MGKKVCIVSLGCAKNLVDSEGMLYKLKEAGYELCAEEASADAVIVNTCGFIESAVSEAVETILDVASHKKSGSLKALIVTGCMPARYKHDVKQEIPEIDAVLDTGSYKDIVAAVDAALKGENTDFFAYPKCEPLEINRIISTGATAYIKIAEGCDNRCSYCLIPMIRGSYRSRKIEDIVAETTHLAKQGVKELIVIAQDITRYGLDNYGEHKLPELLQRVCKIDGIRWVRLMYLYPDEISDELINTIKTEEKIVKYLDIPLQHADNKILKAMNRRGGTKEYADLIAKLRTEIPDIVLRTTFITGFPGEGDAEFEALCNFVKSQRFDRLGVFAYSDEEESASFGLSDKIDESEKKKRAEIVMDTQSVIFEQSQRCRVGNTYDVLCEGYDRDLKLYFGRAYFDAPDIDTKIFFTSKHPISEGDFTRVKILDVIDFDLTGEAL